MEENQNLGYHGYPVTDAVAVSSGGARDWQSLLQMPMTKTRIEFLHFLHIYNEWITKSQRDPKELQVLLVNNGLSPHCMHPSYWFNRIWDSEIYDQQVNDPQTLRAIRQRFAREEHKVYSILQSHDFNHFPYGKPSPNDRWRDAVWSIGMLFAEMYATLDATQKARTDWQTSDDPERGPFVMPPDRYRAGSGAR